LATGHADTFNELLDSLESELRDVLGHYREQRKWVGLTDEELLGAYGWQEEIEKNRFWEDTHPILEKARQDMLVGLRKVEAKLKEKNGG
jgi:hypothetical protein